ncbi:hypothetical protein JKP88DRAFT_274653 [Tribonema minus]|uniref:Uncharacterized protein n=1 Tax=Tribonema minus TaxID=303371 RepID=A0A836CPB9_9STRA|nr:hypothetical protein JKP88DRAFT_274653 [Tribonema minus]
MVACCEGSLQALLRMDLTPSRIVLVDEDRAVVDAALTRAAMDRCAALLDMAVAHRQKRGDDGGAGSGGSGGGGGGGIGGGGGGTVVACDYRAARDSGGDSSGSNGGAATIRRRGAACAACVDPQGAMALMPHVRRALPRQMRGEGASRHNLGDVYKILRAPTRIDPQANTLALTPVYPAHPIADHAHLHHDMACVYALRTVYAGMGSVAARRAGRHERALVPLLNEVDDEPFCSDHFT